MESSERLAVPCQTASMLAGESESVPMVGPSTSEDWQTTTPRDLGVLNHGVVVFRPRTEKTG